MPETEPLHHSPLVHLLLERRGITTKDEADRFLSPHYRDHTHDPFLLRGMEEAVARILKAVENNETVLIYSDFDADGIPGAVVLHDFFKEVGFANFTNYIPHRHDEGFGVHLDAVEQFAEDGVSLIITIDCGIADVSEVARARELGMDIIVTDHHESGSEVPDATAVVDPKQPGCEYPNKDICGAGVVYKLVQALIARGSFDIAEGREKWYLDMVGLATLSDMVPLTGENRVFAHYGLMVLRKSPRVGLVTLLRQLKIQQRTLTEDDVGFMISPRINAASRMGVSQDAFRFLSTRSESEAKEVVKHLSEINDERKGLVASMVKAIKKRVKEEHTGTPPPVIVAGDPTWRPSLLGLAANTLVEEYDRPVFLWGRDGRDTLKGSARSNGRVDLVQLMQAAGDVFEQSGGHHSAGGFAVSLAYVGQLQQRLADAVEQVGESAMEGPDGVVDTELTLEDVNNDVYNEIAKLAPFGVDNPKPTFYFRRVVVRDIATFGKQNNHLKLTFHTEAGRPIEAIAFFKSKDSFTGDIHVSAPVNVIATMEQSHFRGRPELRLRIVDVE